MLNFRIHLPPLAREVAWPSWMSTSLWLTTNVNQRKTWSSLVKIRAVHAHFNLCVVCGNAFKYSPFLLLVFISPYAFAFPKLGYRIPWSRNTLLEVEANAPIHENCRATRWMISSQHVTVRGYKSSYTHSGKFLRTASRKISMNEGSKYDTGLFTLM